jgi:citrate lyase beta subunit
MLLTADAAGVPAIDGSPSAGRDARLRFEQARRQGFAGLLVSDPAEIAALT